jgi:hypothetical protein
MFAAFAMEIVIGPKPSRPERTFTVIQEANDQRNYKGEKKTEIKPTVFVSRASK